MNPALPSVAIPTFGREEILISTLQRVVALGPPEILVIDQTPKHGAHTERQLEEWSRAGTILLHRLPEPSIPHAMNQALLMARADVVLFLDDDVIPAAGLLEAHARAHMKHIDALAVVGQVLQPGEDPVPLRTKEAFRFNSTQETWISKAMAGNMSVKRDRAVAAGGFDENFLGAAYMFETEFAERVLRCGGRIFFDPSASIRHLRAPRGGTRSYGSHLRTLSPAHASGAYYHMFLTFGMFGATAPVLGRFFSSVATRHHLKHPWWIPATLIAELRGLRQGILLFRKGPHLLQKGGAL
jgi:GT2 family glycosyltransferase